MSRSISPSGTFSGIGVISEIPLAGQVAAISCGIWKGAAVLDLDYAEDSTAQADANFVLTGKGAHRRGAGYGRR